MSIPNPTYYGNTTPRTAVSYDGFRVCYTEIRYPSANPNPIPNTTGRKPHTGVVLLCGDLMTSPSLGVLSHLLAADTTLPIYLMDRGRESYLRPSSSPRTASVETMIQHEIEDIAAVLRETGARAVLGVNGGALVALHAALALCSSEDDESLIRQLVVFEPTLVTEAGFEKGRARFEQEVEERRRGHALSTAMGLSCLGTWKIRMAFKLMVKMVGDMDPEDAKQHEEHDIWMNGGRKEGRQERELDAPGRFGPKWVAIDPVAGKENDPSVFIRPDKDDLEDGEVPMIWAPATTVRFDFQLISQTQESEWVEKLAC
jgi:hypothetical protein